MHPTPCILSSDSRTTVDASTAPLLVMPASAASLLQPTPQGAGTTSAVRWTAAATADTPLPSRLPIPACRHGHGANTSHQRWAEKEGGQEDPSGGV
jgi:hypothetical protein